MSPLLRTVLTETVDLLGRTIKVAIIVSLLTFGLILIGWLFSSSLPSQILFMLNGR